MKIKSCEIKNFGKLSDKTIDLSDGITVIKGANESGKSTLSAFVKFVLYGFSGKGRDERNNEKLKFAPWNGQKCSGALILEDAEHTLFRAERSFDGKSTKGKILDSAGCECFKGYDAGEIFFGTDSTAFSKSSFVGQDEIEPDDMKDLGSSLEKLLMQGGKDDADFEKAAKTLTSERNKLYNKMRSTGRVFELEAEINKLRQKREEESEKNARLNVAEFAASEAEKNLQTTNSRLASLYAEAENIEAYKAFELLGKIDDAHDKYESAQRIYSETSEKYALNGFVPGREYLTELENAHSEYLSVQPEYLTARMEHENAVQRYDSAVEKLRGGEHFDIPVDDDGKSYAEVFKKAEALSTKNRKLKLFAILLLFPIVTIPVALVLFGIYSKSNKELKKLLGQYGFESYGELEKYRAVYDEIYPTLSEIKRDEEEKHKFFNSKKQSLDNCAKKLSECLSKYGYAGDFAADEKYLRKIGTEIIPEVKTRVYEIEKCFEEYSKHKNAYDTLVSVSDIEELKEKASKKQSEPPNRPKEEVDRAIKYDEGAKSLLTKKLTDCKTEIAALGASVSDPADIESEIFRLEKELEEAKLHSGALDLAIEIMEKSAQTIRGNTFPEISERAGVLFAKFTGGKYRNLFFDKNFSLSVLEENDTEIRKIGYLSSGAIDTAYIALRVALAEYLCKDKPFLVFDDSFAKIDDERLKNILSVLVSLSDEYQIIILTCHQREEKILGEKCKTVTLG